MSLPKYEKIRAWIEVDFPPPPSGTAFDEPIRIPGIPVKLTNPPTPPLPVADTKTYEIISFRVVYTVDDIPTAHCRLAVGRKAGLSVGGVVAKVSELGQRLPVRIYLERNMSAEKIFDGYLASVGSFKDSSQGRTSLAITCIHWLDDMRGTTAYSDRHSPRGAFPDEIRAGFWFDKNWEAVLTKLNDRVSMEAVQNAISDQFAGGDFWQVIYRVMNSIMRVSIGGTRLVQNTAGIEASKKFRGFLVFSSAGFMAEQLGRDAVAADVSSAFATAMEGGSLWSILRILATLFRFMIIPTRDAVFFVPSSRSIKSNKILTVLPGDKYATSRSGRVNRRAIRSVVVSGGAHGLMPDLDKRRLKAALKFTSSQKQGIIEFVRGPQWLLDVAHLRGDQTFKLGKGLIGRGNVNAVKLGGAFGGRAKQINDFLVNREAVGRAWCRAVYNDMTYGGNQLVLQTPVEYDILPGLCIGVRATDAVWVAGGSVEERLSFAFVHSVTLVADSESHYCARELQLTHLRSARDDDNDAAVKHPLFECGIPMGGELVPGAIAYSLSVCPTSQFNEDALITREALGPGATSVGKEPFIPTTPIYFDGGPIGSKALILGEPTGSFKTAMETAAPTFWS